MTEVIADSSTSPGSPPGSSSREQVQPPPGSNNAGPGQEEWVQFRLPSAPLGLVEVEAQRGALLSAARPLLVLPCARAAAELCELEANQAGGWGCASWLSLVWPKLVLLVLGSLRAPGMPPEAPGRGGGRGKGVAAWWALL